MSAGLDVLISVLTLLFTFALYQQISGSAGEMASVVGQLARVPWGSLELSVDRKLGQFFSSTRDLNRLILSVELVKTLAAVTLAAMASVGLGAAAFRRFVRKERSERVPSRTDLKTQSEKAEAKVERAARAAERRRWREEEEERKAAEETDSD